MRIAPRHMAVVVQLPGNGHAVLDHDAHAANAALRTFDGRAYGLLIRQCTGGLEHHVRRCTDPGRLLRQFTHHAQRERSQCPALLAQQRDHIHAGAAGPAR